MALDLVHDLADASGDIGRAAEVLVERLARHFGWEHVSIFQLDEDSGGFRILRQARGANTLQLPDNFWQRADRGLVGLAFRQGRTINASDVRRGKYARRFADKVPGTRSELCMRVPGAHSRWVLNIESSQENAFAEEEKETVELIVREAGLILERAALLEIRKAVLNSINDAVITTDRRGTIRDANPAAGRLIGCPRKALRDTKLSDVIDDPDTARAMREPEGLCRRETVLVRRDGQRVPVLISAELMPANLGGKVFVLSDLTYQKELQRVGLIREVFRQAALETKVPLSLAASYLAQLKEEGTANPRLLDKILKQLRKVDLPLERLLRLAAEDSAPDRAPARADVRQVVGGVLRELADADCSEVEIAGIPRNTAVAVSRDTLAFCVESMLAFALRTRPLDRRVRVAVQADDGVARVSVAGDWHPLVESGGGSGVANAWRRRAIIDLSLGEEILDSVARKAGGEFHTTLDNDAPLKLELELPLSDAQV
jgi:PAS domain S-box-containing protein